MGISEKITSVFRRRPKSEEKTFISVVLLLRRPAALSEGMLHDSAVRAWGREFRPEQNEQVVVQGPLGIITFEGRIIHTINSARPYVDNPEKEARRLKEMRQQKIMKEHKAWMSFDLLAPQNPAEPEKAECYRRICSLAAQFADSVCLGVYFTEQRFLRSNDATLRDCLTSANPREEIKNWENVPVVTATKADLQNAVAEARRRWPEFVQAFGNRKPDQPFSVKAPFTDGVHTEWMWVMVSEIRGETVEGELGNNPVDVKNLREGDLVQVQAKDIGDWIYADERRNPVGGFSVAVLAKSSKAN